MYYLKKYLESNSEPDCDIFDTCKEGGYYVVVMNAIVTDDLQYAENIKKELNKMISELKKDSKGYKIYDTSLGHCALCGRMGCYSKCIK